MATKFLAGKTGRTVVGGDPIAHQQWSATYHGDDLDTTNFESNGKDEGLIGIVGVDFSAKGNWDAQKNPIGAPPGLYPRDDGGVDGKAIQFFTKTGGQNFNFPLWRILDCTINVEVRGLVTFDYKGKSQGNFTEPQGNA